MPHRKALGELGEECARHEECDRATMHRPTSAVLREGDAVAEAAMAEARRVLSAYGSLFGEDGAVEGAVLPESLRATGRRRRRVAGRRRRRAGGAHRGRRDCDGRRGGAQARRRPPARDGEDDRQARLNSRVRWRNNLDDVHPGARVLRELELERDSSQVAFESIDAVLVPEQAAKHVQGGRPEMRADRSYARHWDVRVDADGKSMYLTSTSEADAYLLLMGALVPSGLITRRLTRLRGRRREQHRRVHRALVLALGARGLP